MACALQKVNDLTSLPAGISSIQPPLWISGNEEEMHYCCQSLLRNCDFFFFLSYQQILLTDFTGFSNNHRIFVHFFMLIFALDWAPEHSANLTNNFHRAGKKKYMLEKRKVLILFQKAEIPLLMHVKVNSSSLIAGEGHEIQNQAF